MSLPMWLLGMPLGRELLAISSGVFLLMGFTGGEKALLDFDEEDY